MNSFTYTISFVIGTAILIGLLRYIINHLDQMRRNHNERNKN